MYLNALFFPLGTWGETKMIMTIGPEWEIKDGITKPCWSFLKSQKTTKEISTKIIVSKLPRTSMNTSVK